MSEPGYRANWNRLREAQRAVPFRPFTIHLIDGRSFRLADPENLFLSPTGASIFLVASGRGEEMDILDLTYVREIEMLPPTAASA